MTQLEILVYPDERLQQISQPVMEVNNEVRSFISDLEETLSSHSGCVGIAAPQVGRLERIIIVDVSARPQHKNHGHLVLINPVITSNEGNSVGRVAAYGGFSINGVRKGKGGLGVGYWGHPGKGNIRATGNIQANNGIKVTGGRTHFQDAERKGRLRVGAAWGIPGLYSEDNQDIVIGCRSNRQVHLGRPNLVRIDQRGNLHLPRGANIYVGGRKVVKNGDPITLRSGRNGYRMQHSNWNSAARFSNRNRGGWERMYVETF